MNIRVTAEDAGWTIREAAWGFEERVVWRGSDAARDGLERAGERLQPLQRLVQTRLTWPVADAFRARGMAARRAIAGSAAAAVLAAATAGALTAPGEESPTAPAPLAPPIEAVSEGEDTLVLQGATPTFVPADAPPAPRAPAEKPSEAPARVAWRFAHAFVAYEVGRTSKKTTATFAATATPPLAKALADDPPRLPADAKVPEARVLNVVLGDTTKKQSIVSVSLIRLRALSEVRLTLQRDGESWRVAQVLG